MTPFPHCAACDGSGVVKLYARSDTDGVLVFEVGPCLLCTTADKQPPLTPTEPHDA